MPISFRVTLTVISVILPCIARGQELQGGMIKLLCDDKREVGRRPFGGEKSIVEYSQPCWCYLFWRIPKLFSFCPVKSDGDCQEVCENHKRFEQVEIATGGNSGDDLGPESVMTLCKEEEEISRKPLGEKMCLVEYRRKCGCSQDRTSESKPKDEPCDCSDTLCEEDSVYFKVEDKDDDGCSGGGGSGGGGSGGSGENGVVKPGPAAPTYRSQEEFLCKPCFERYEWYVESGQELGSGNITHCFKKFSMECGCMLDENGNVVPKPGVDCECMPLGCSLRGTFPGGVETFTVTCSPAECNEARDNGASEHYP